MGISNTIIYKLTTSKSTSLYLPVILIRGQEDGVYCSNYGPLVGYTVDTYITHTITVIHLCNRCICTTSVLHYHQYNQITIHHFNTSTNDMCVFLPGVQDQVWAVNLWPLTVHICIPAWRMNQGGSSGVGGAKTLTWGDWLHTNSNQRQPANHLHVWTFKETASLIVFVE